MILMTDEYPKASNELTLYKVWFWGSQKSDWMYVAASGWKELIEHFGGDVADIQRIEDVGLPVEVVGL